MIEPLRIGFDVQCSLDHAFTTWTLRINHWWPADHTVTGRADAEVVLEPRVGGRIFERTPEGTEHEWGEVTVWDPPNRLGYLWHMRRDRADATQVEIRFQADGPTTRVEVEHTGWERLGAAAQEWRDRNVGGWTSLAPHFLTEAERAPDPSRPAPGHVGQR